MLIAMIKRLKSPTLVNVVTFFHYTIRVTTLPSYYSNQYWVHKWQGVRNFVQWPGYKMDERIVSFDSWHRQQVFHFSSVFRPDVELNRPTTNQVFWQCRSTKYEQFHQYAMLCALGGNITFTYRLFRRTSNKALYVDQHSFNCVLQRMVWYLHTCKCFIDTKRITANIHNSLSLKH